MPAPPSVPGPGEPRPLSDRERRELDRVERHLTESAPQLAAGLRRIRRRRPERSTPLDHVLQAVAVTVVLVLVLPDAWRAGLAVVAVLVFATAVGLYLEPERRAGRPDDRG